MLDILYLTPVFATLIAVLLLKKFDRRVGVIAAIGSAIQAAAILPILGSAAQYQELQWFAFGNNSITLGFNTAPLNVLLFTIVAIIAPLVIFYSDGYMNNAADRKRFFAEMLAFELSMLLFALAGNMITLFIAWELLSVVSYLLIGFWNNLSGAPEAARHAITVVFLGDVALLAAVAMSVSAFGSVEFSILFTSLLASPAMLLAFSLLLLIAIATKSALFPFQSWLPDAMAGPTPVSALLHSSTMVKAGIFLALLAFPIITQSGIGKLLTLICAATMAIGAAGLLLSGNIKRALAYSTLEELGLMGFVIGLGSYPAALFLFFAQSFYKALLFLYSGALTSVTKNYELSKITYANAYLPLFVSGIFGALALSGMPPFNGFFANILIDSALSGIITKAFLLFVLFALSFGIFLWLLKPTKKSISQAAGARTKLFYSFLPGSMILPIIVLAALSLFSSFFYQKIAGTGINVVSLNVASGATYTLVAILGIMLAYAVNKNLLPMPRSRKNNAGKNISLAANMARRIRHGISIYVYAFVAYVASFVYFIDLTLDHYVERSALHAISLVERARNMQNGMVSTYLFVAFAALVLVLLFLVIK